MAEKGCDDGEWSKTTLTPFAPFAFVRRALVSVQRTCASSCQRIAPAFAHKMEEKAVAAAAAPCAGRVFWETCRVTNLSLKGWVYPVYFTQAFPTSRGANPTTYVYRSLPFQTAVAAAVSMRYVGPVVRSSEALTVSKMS